MLPKLSLKQKTTLLEHFSDPEDIYACENFGRVPGVTSEMADVLENKDLTAAQGVLTNCKKKDIGILTILDAAYPKRLFNIHEPPILLYYKGVLPDFEKQPVIGVVGTRRASGYGLNNARQMAAQITNCGGLVVSGGAGGIDTTALEGALEAGGPAVAVLGCGVDVAYPRNNRMLFSKIEANGCLISEYLPGTQPKPWQFPERNRIISGLSNGVLVVEAPEKSGALNTARHALEQGRDVFAVPGNVDSPSCRGSNGLLEEGAYPALSGWGVVRQYAPEYPASVAQKPMIPENLEPAAAKADKKSIDKLENSTYSVVNKPTPALSDSEQVVLARLDKTPMALDTLIDSLDLSAMSVKSILTKLTVKGLVVNHPGGRVSRK